MRRTRIEQEQTTALAYKIMDAGAEGGILVSPMPLQEGAEKVAGAEGILHVTLTPDSTNKEYLMAFLSSVLIGRSDEVRVNLTEHAIVAKYDESGRLIEDE